MKILVASDFHGHLSAIERVREKALYNKVDAIVLCGDITHLGTISLVKGLLEKLSIENVAALFVPGNMDPKEAAGEEIIAGTQNLHGRCRKITGLSFIGVGGCIPGPFHTPFETSEQELQEVLLEAFGTLDDKKRFGLVSHNPPFNTRVDITPIGVHVGSRSLRSFIEKSKPVITFCGHIHEARGIDEIGETTIINPGPAFKGFYALVDIDKEVSVELCS